MLVAPRLDGIGACCHGRDTSIAPVRVELQDTLIPAATTAATISVAPGRERQWQGGYQCRAQHDQSPRFVAGDRRGA